MDNFRLSLISASKWEMFIYICITNIKYGKNMRHQFHRSELTQFKYKSLSHSLMPLFGLTKVKEYENVIQSNLNKMFKTNKLERVTGEGLYNLTNSGVENAKKTYAEFVDIFSEPSLLIRQLDDKILSKEQISYINIFKDIDSAYLSLKKLGILTPEQCTNGLKKINERKELLQKFQGVEKEAALESKSLLYEKYKDALMQLGYSKEYFINIKS